MERPWLVSRLALRARAGRTKQIFKFSCFSWGFGELARVWEGLGGFGRAWECLGGLGMHAGSCNFVWYPSPPRPDGLECPWLSEQAGSGSSSRPGQADFQHFHVFLVFLVSSSQKPKKKCIPALHTFPGLPGTPRPSQTLPDPPRPSQAPFHGFGACLSEQAGSGSLSRSGQTEVFFRTPDCYSGSPRVNHNQRKFEGGAMCF